MGTQKREGGNAYTSKCNPGIWTPEGKITTQKPLSQITTL